MTSGPSPQEERALIAAEYALGLLEGAELAEARHRAATDAAFADDVTRWEVRLAALADDLAPETPHPAVKQALLAELFAHPPRARLWQRLWVWQAAAVFSAALLAVVLAFDFGVFDRTQGPLYTAEIATGAGDFRVVAVVDKSTDQIVLTRTQGAPPTGRILQVWGHGADEPTVSIGLWPAGDTIRLPLPPVIAAVRGVLTIGVSEEPPGGSTTGLPSGRVFGTVDIAGVARAP